MDRKMAVYIVDDDPAIGRALKALAEAMGLDAEGYESAEAFLEAYQPSRSGCLILDMSLPGMNGLERQTELRDRSLALPVILIAGHGTEQIRTQAMTSGAIAVLEKPCRIGQLCEAVKTAIGFVGKVWTRGGAKHCPEPSRRRNPAQRRNSGQAIAARSTVPASPRPVCGVLRSCGQGVGYYGPMANTCCRRLGKMCSGHATRAPFAGEPLACEGHSCCQRGPHRSQVECAGTESANHSPGFRCSFSHRAVT